MLTELTNNLQDARLVAYVSKTAGAFLFKSNIIIVFTMTVAFQSLNLVYYFSTTLAVISIFLEYLSKKLIIKPLYLLEHYCFNCKTLTLGLRANDTK